VRSRKTARESELIRVVVLAAWVACLVSCTHTAPLTRREARPPSPPPDAGVAVLPPPIDAAPPEPPTFPAPAAGQIDAAVADAIAAHKLPGAVVVVGRHDRVLFRKAYGFRQLQPAPLPMTEDTVFDLASLTKPIATATSIMVLVEKGRVSLDDPLPKYVPECATKGKAGITLRHLLLHTSGLPADTPVGDFGHGRGEVIARICNVSARGAPGEKTNYSDIGYVLLEEVVRRVTGEELPAFADASVFTPLGMRETSFTPSDALKARAATTEQIDGEWRVGVVHDPRSFLLGGVAGHAGLFSTADDLAVYARAVLGWGEVDGKRALSAATVADMIAPVDVPGGVRTLGWVVDSRWKGEGMSPRAFGHFGWTGTAIWLDPEKDLFTVVLTNRVHPDGQGDSKPLVARVNAIAAETIGPRVGRVAVCEPLLPVRTGIDVLREEGFERLRGARVGLITNATGRARDGVSTIDLLLAAPRVKLVALFTPEHGLAADQTTLISSGRDERTGLPVYSLYGEIFAPTAATLAGVDTLVFDIQDVGTRFYTYASTMRKAMIAGREHGVRFLVLDRPNPIDGVDVAGPILPASSRSFVNHHALPVRHGMTIGELAYLFNADDHLGVDLSVVPMRGWGRAAYWEDTGLPWVNPSPNLRSTTEALLYPGVGLLEASNLSVGRGTEAPFEQLGAPWIDADALATALTGEGLGGVSFAPIAFTPTEDRYAGKACHGVRVVIRDRAQFEPVQLALAIARVLRRMYPDWQFVKLGPMLAAPEAMAAIDAGKPLVAIEDTFKAELAAFRSKRDKYLLYDSAVCNEVAAIRGP
jgi:uncharacterized protein YbbC (DUF1343 family)/CubicO group peptidase (beta-lactamase class C family)